MKHKIRSRVLTVMLSLMLIIGLMPATALAAGTATVKINGQVLQDGIEVQCGDGTAVWDEESGTLTLDNATINQDSSTSPGTPVLRADNVDLKIVLIGENTITSTTQRPVYLTSGEYTIQGSENDSLIIETDSDGLQIEGGNLTIDGCKIDITSSSYGGMICLGKYNTGEFGILTIQNGANIDINSFENTLMSEYGLSITDSTVNATARSNYQDWSTCAVSSYGNLSIANSAVTAAANGDAANAIYGGTISINNSEGAAVTTSQINAYPALCAGGDIDITNHSSVSANSASTIGIWSSGGAIEIQNSIAKVTANDEWSAIRGDNGGVTINGSWVEAFGNEVSSELTSSDSAIFLNNEGTVSGSLTLPGSVTVSEDMQLSIPEDSSITVPDGVTFTNHGQIELLGELAVNGGSIVCDSHVGGTATCTSKAVCDICGEEYGNLVPHNLTKTEEKDATCTADGNTAYWICSECDKYFADADGKTEVALADTVIKATGHKFADGKCTVCGAIDSTFKAVITAGANSTWQKGTKIGLSFTSNAAFADFLKVQVDGKDLDASNYTVKEGSTIVTLKAEYLGTLSVGKHTLAIVSDTGTATTEFTIKAAADSSSQTGDDFNIALYAGLAILAAAGAVGTGIYRRREQ